MVNIREAYLMKKVFEDLIIKISMTKSIQDFTAPERKIANGDQL
jgi:hypothetical protein